MEYPPARRDESVEDGDAYRWMEESSAELTAWVEAQNALFHSFIGDKAAAGAAGAEAESVRQKLYSAFKAQLEYERFSTPFKRGKRFFAFYNSGTLDHALLMKYESLKDEQPVVLLDPNQWSDDKSVALGGVSFSESGEYLAFTKNHKGSDWRTLHVMRVSDGKMLKDELFWIKFSSIEWWGDSGFFYCAFDPPPAFKGKSFYEVDAGTEVDKNEYQKAYYHELGTPQEQDVLICGTIEEDKKQWMWGLEVTDDQQYLVVTASKSTEHQNLLSVLPLRKLRKRIDRLQNPDESKNKKKNNNKNKKDKKGSGGKKQKKKDGKGKKKKNGDNKKKKNGKKDGKDKGANNNNDKEEKKKKQKKKIKAPTRQRMLKFAAKLQGAMVHVVTDFYADFEYISNDGTKFTLLTDYHAARKCVINVDLEDARKRNWKVLVPESHHSLDNAFVVANDNLVLVYLQDVCETMRVHSLESGDFLYNIEPPTKGALAGCSGRRQDKSMFYGFSSFAYPKTIFRFNFKKRETTVFKAPKVPNFDPQSFETKQIFFNSKDGTRVPMFVTHRKGIEYNGENPTVLYGYGGFQISLTPYFSSLRAVLMQHLGVVYAVVNTRGGGEYGKEWWKAGIKGGRMRVYEDFCGAAEQLIASGYTSPAKLGINGGSNGGTLVAACANLRPELFGAVVADVGVMDLLRFHLFTIGKHWTPDFGDPEDAEEREMIKKYSPLHNIRSDVPYPAILALCAAHDDRVVPLHTYKYVAQLQHTLAANKKHTAPILARIETKAGHGAGKSLDATLHENAEKWAFYAKVVNAEWSD